MLDEEFIEDREWMLKDDLEGFNRELMRYLIWYNTERVQSKLGNVSPLWRGFVINLTRIPLSLKSYGLIQRLVRMLNFGKINFTMLLFQVFRCFLKYFGDKSLRLINNKDCESYLFFEVKEKRGYKCRP